MNLLELQFKGTRRYLHGSDIFSGLINFFGSQYDPGFISRLALRRFAENQIEVIVDTPISSAERIGSGFWQFTNGTGISFSLRETAIKVVSSYDYPEELFKEAVTIRDTTVSITRFKLFSTIETIIAITKILHIQLNNSCNKKWVFVQSNFLCALPVDWKLMTVQRYLVVDNIFSRNSVMIDGKNFGEIRFMAV